MEKAITRAELLRGMFGSSDQNDTCELPRPPGVGQTHEFFKNCNGCGDCVAACPSRLIALDEQNKAFLDFAQAKEGCTFCFDCTKVCTQEALKNTSLDAWYYKAELKLETCLSMQGVTCRTCGDVCDERAIQFQLLTRGRALPQIKTETCIGCGDCVVLCPSQALEIIDRKINRKEVI